MARGVHSFVPQAVDPDFFRVFELTTTLPGPSSLVIEAWDYDAVSKDDFIGTPTAGVQHTRTHAHRCLCLLGLHVYDLCYRVADAAGKTTIDLEDRIFHPAWKAFGTDVPLEKGRYPPKPVERRNLWNPMSTTSQVRVWLPRMALLVVQSPFTMWKTIFCRPGCPGDVGRYPDARRSEEVSAGRCGAEASTTCLASLGV